MVSGITKQMCRFMNTQELQTAVYRPACDGLVERFNRTLEAMLACYVTDNQTDWDVLLPYVLFAYRTASQESTGESPFFLNRGRDLVLPLDISIKATDVSEQSVGDFKTELAGRIQAAWAVASATFKKTQTRQKRYYDQKFYNRGILLGDRVFMHVPQIGKGRYLKLAKPWRGSYRVLQISDYGTGAEIGAYAEPGRKVVFRANVRRLSLASPESCLQPLSGQTQDLEELEACATESSPPPEGEDLGCPRGEAATSPIASTHNQLVKQISRKIRKRCAGLSTGLP